ncbi:putative uncharacterized protein DDB_G0279653 [Amyelois transitella]|uniref:putative uncharacterized protein DDB_G0279653 n=1 Tax=Amyelois transitella TaxID=680683 RepID=UPI00299019B2|nr:putative uncharacterized protein DDB_G0279653 [Amyelois transitella]
MLRFVTFFAVAVVLASADPQPVNIFKTDITPDEAQQYLNSPPFTDPQLSGRTAVLPLVRWNDPSFRAAEAGPTLGHYWKNGKEIENTNDYLEEVYNAAQFHGQDGLGAYTYGYKAPESSKVENRVRSGDVTGSYVYKAGPGNDDLIKVRYWADSEGFHQEDNIPKFAPQQVEETAEVKEARLAHEKAWQEAVDNVNHPLEYQQKQQQQLFQQWQKQGIDVNSLPQISQFGQNNADQNNAQQQHYPQHQQHQNQYQSGQQYQAAYNQQYQGAASNQQYLGVPSNQQYQAASNSQYHQVPSNQQYQSVPPNQQDSTNQYQAAASTQQNQYSLPPSGPKDVIPAASNQQYQAVPSQYQGGQQHQSSQSSQQYQKQQTYQASQQQQNQLDDGSYNKEKYEDPEPTGPPRGFFYSFDYPVSIIVAKSDIQGGATNPGQPVDHDTVAVSGQHY